MTVEFSIQKLVSDGTLSTVVLGIQYLQRNDIYMRIAGEETPQSGAPSGYTWAFINNTTLNIIPVVPAGVEVTIYRRTDIDAMYNIYSQNAQFDEATIDENNQQLLYIAQEYLEQGIPGAGVESLEYINTVLGINYYRFRLTDGSVTSAFGVPDGTVQLRSELSSSIGASLIGSVYNRTLADKIADVISVKDFGAVGDGVADDYAAIQAAVNSNAKRIYFPAGTYYSSQSIKLKHTTSYYLRDTGQVFWGDGISTILTRNNITDTQGPTEIEWDQRSFFGVYGSYNEFHCLQFYGCPVAIYFGQDPAKIGIELSHCSFNKMQNLLVQNCGTGFLSACARGHYYNHYEAIHIVQCQIAVYFTVHSSWPTPTVSNNNRNTFLNIRAARCQVGFWLSNGDTNSSYSFHCEGCGNTPTDNTYPVPIGLPGGLTTATFIIDADNNSFYGCSHEACGFYVYHDALNTQSFGNLFRINEEPAKQNFVTPMYHHLDRDTTWLSGGSFASISNNNVAFPNTTAGYAVTQATKGDYSVGSRTSVETNANSSRAFELEYLKPLGAVAALGTVSLTIWQEVSVQTAASSFFEITVVGNSQTNSFVHANTFKVIALRNASRTLTRYNIYDQTIGRATGAGAGDGTEPITPALSIGGVGGKDLIVTFTMPNRTFESVSVMVKQLYSRAP